MRYLETILKNFDKNDLNQYPSADIHGVPEWKMVTQNGEICYDHETGLFKVFDETYTCIVGETLYPLVAVSVLKSYHAHYLGGLVE